MKIVLVNRYFHPDQSATSRMVSSLAFGLARKGLSVTAVASRSLYEGGAAVLPARECVQDVEVRRLSASGFGRGRLAGRSVDYATFHARVAAWLAANLGRGDICVVCTDPPLLSVSAALPARLHGAHLVSWVMDLFPEVAMELGVVSEQGAAGRLALALRDWSLGIGALTICPMPAMSRHLAARLGRHAAIATVRHWANDDEIRPIDPADNPLRREWGLRDAFVVGYSGNFGRAHEFGTLIAAAELLRDQPVMFLMIGDGPRKAAVEAEARRLGLANMIFKPYQASCDLAHSLSAPDVHIVSLLPRLEHCVVPSKLYGILAAGRPTLFVGDPDGEVGSVLASAGCGAAVAPGHSDLLAALIMELRSNPVKGRAMGARARALLGSDYSLDAGIARWSAAIQHLMPRPRAAAAGAAREAAT